MLDYQAKLDEARSRSSHGDLTKKQLDDVDADLKASAPPAVRQKFGLPAPHIDTDARPDMDRIMPVQVDELDRRTQMAPAPADP